MRVKHQQNTRAIRWFLLLWFLFVALGSFRNVLLDLWRDFPNLDGFWWLAPVGPNGRGALPNMWRDVPTMPNWLFTTILAVYGVLLWLGLNQHISRRFYWLYCLAQGCLVLSIGFFAHQSSLMVNLSLLLILSALTMYDRVKPVIWVTLGVLGGFGALVLIERFLLHPEPPGPLNRPGSPEDMRPLFWFTLWDMSESVAMIFFVIGYLLLYAQQRKTQTELEHTFQKLQIMHDQLAESNRQIETLTLLSERRRLARELHDTLAQGVAGLIMQLEVAQAQLSRRRLEQTGIILQQSVQSARATLKEARLAITDLRVRTTKQTDLLTACYEEIARFTQATSVEVETHIEDLVLLSEQQSEHVLRFLREALTNIARHAQATAVRIMVELDEDGLILNVEDNGQGFEPEMLEHRNGHYGLLGLRERARILHGRLEIRSILHEGTELSLWLPREDQRSTPSPEEPLHA